MERYTVPSPILFGAGAVARLGKVAVENGMSRPLLVSDRGLAACGLLEKAQSALTLRRLSFDADRQTVVDVDSNPTEENVMAALERYREVGADGIVAFGGGSAIDAAKALRLLTSHDGTLVDYDFLQGGLQKIVAPLPPMVAVPTTAGTGSEVSRGALIVTRRGEIVRKTLVASARLVPNLALLDPELTVGLPPALTAGTGIDALTHGIEEHLSPRFHPAVEALALGSVERIARALPAAMLEPENLEARGDLLLAALMGGVGFEKGLGVGHSLSHAIGALHPLHHGLINAVLLPFALEFNRDHCVAATWTKLARALNVPGLTEGGAFESVLAWSLDLRKRLDIPERLRNLRDLSADRDEILARAFDDHCHRTNPRPCAPEELKELWEAAY